MKVSDKVRTRAPGRTPLLSEPSSRQPFAGSSKSDEPERGKEMKHQDKFRLRLEDGRGEPIPGLEGASRIIMIDEEQVGAQDITFGYSKYKPQGSIHKKHTHPHAEEIMYILAGRGIGGVNDEEMELKAGDTLWVPRGATHWFYNPFEETCEFLFLYTRSTLQKAGLQPAESKG